MRTMWKRCESPWKVPAFCQATQKQSLMNFFNDIGAPRQPGQETAQPAVIAAVKHVQSGAITRRHAVAEAVMRSVTSASISSSFMGAMQAIGLRWIRQVSTVSTQKKVACGSKGPRKIVATQGETPGFAHCCVSGAATMRSSSICQLPRHSTSTHAAIAVVVCAGGVRVVGVGMVMGAVVDMAVGAIGGREGLWVMPAPAEKGQNAAPVANED